MFVEYVNEEMIRELPPCAECGMPAIEGRHTSPSPDVPCRDGFPAGPAGCAAPYLHHLYQLPVDALATRPIMRCAECDAPLTNAERDALALDVDFVGHGDGHLIRIEQNERTGQR